MKQWKTRTSEYSLMVVAGVLFVVLIFILADSLKTKQVKESLTTYMHNLRDMVFMSTYDSLKKGNMKLFKSHLEEIGTFDDVREFSLLDTKGLVHYSSDPELVEQVDARVIGLDYQEDLHHGGFTTYYFPVETISYCYRCHPTWKIGSINSYYKLTLSREALDTAERSSNYYQTFTIVGGGMFATFLYLLLSQYERKKREEQMLLSDSVRNFMDSTAEIFITINPEGICTFCNQAGVRLLGYKDQKELIGRNLHETIHHTHADGSSYPKEDCLAQTALFHQGDSVILKETLLWRADGSSFAAEYRAHPITKAGVIFGATVTFQDITDKKDEESRAIHLAHLASLGELAAGVGHEINNPIGGVINYTKIYKNNYKTDERGTDLLNRIIKEGERIAKIVHSLLHYAHQGDENISMLNIGDVIEETLHLFQTQINREGIHLELDIDDDISSVKGNFQNLEQVMMNLLSNSRYALNEKYPKGSHADKVLRISVENLDKDGSTSVRLKVRDQGTGIPKEILNKVMNPFITTKAAGVGTGLGLNVCFRIVEAHNGQINIESEFGEYTQVTIDLPATDPST